MGRVINKTIIIIELLKVKIQPSPIVSCHGICCVAILIIELLVLS
jgi:hypothetical protein